MDLQGSGRFLSEMKFVAQYIDSSIIELEQVLTSVDGLMPNEENNAQAEKIMGALSEEIKALEEHSCQLKLSLKEQLAKTDKELEMATATNNAIAQGISEIESTLKQYGYDNSSMPAFSPEEITIDDDDDDDDDDIDDGDGDERHSYKYKAAEIKSPPSGMNQLNESMASVEITPLVLSSKSCHSSSQFISPFPKVSPSQTFLKAPITPGGNLYLNSSSPPFKNFAPHNLEKELDEKPLVKRTVLVRPQRPILSKTTYELLGEEPPPEFFEQSSKQGAEI